MQRCVDELCISITDDHSRITLKAENNHSNSDYINASPIVSSVYSLWFYVVANSLSVVSEALFLRQNTCCGWILLVIKDVSKDLSSIQVH